jgi:RES domain
MRLKPPPRGLRELDLTTVNIPAVDLFRISKIPSGEPYFGRTKANRFDDPSRVKKRRFGTCYCGLDLETAIAETLLHDEMPVRGNFKLSFAHFESHQLVGFKGGELILADLTGAQLKTMGGDGSLSTMVPYTVPQRWALAVHRHPQSVDGIRYVSRHLNDRYAIVVFDRALPKIGTARYTPLPTAPGINEALALLHVSFPV